MKRMFHYLLVLYKNGELGAFLCALFGISWSLPNSAREVLIGWRDSLISKTHKKKIWLAAPTCHFWTIWIDRNRAIFEEVVVTTLELKHSSAYTL